MRNFGGLGTTLLRYHRRTDLKNQTFSELNEVKSKDLVLGDAQQTPSQNLPVLDALVL